MKSVDSLYLKTKLTNISATLRSLCGTFVTPNNTQTLLGCVLLSRGIKAPTLPQRSCCINTVAHSPLLKLSSRALQSTECWFCCIKGGRERKAEKRRGYWRDMTFYTRSERERAAYKQNAPLSSFCPLPLCATRLISGENASDLFMGDYQSMKAQLISHAMGSHNRTPRDCQIPIKQQSHPKQLHLVMPWRCH